MSLGEIIQIVYEDTGPAWGFTDYCPPGGSK
jgi:hypothetical protein